MQAAQMQSAEAAASARRDASCAVTNELDWTVEQIDTDELPYNLDKLLASEISSEADAVDLR